MNVHHVGYLVKNIDKAKDTFLKLGYTAETETVYDPIRKIDICFLIKDGYRVELVSPAAEDSVVSGLVKKLGNTPYHICYSTDDFDGEVARLRAAGFMQIDKPTPAPAIGGHRVSFFLNMAIGMIELLDTKGDIAQ